ncbi:GNAT family acetyltransferase [Desulfopila sp. IMCC35008]|uniref:GNAT family acetyltransferase n=1 Tax=Desulfopila sp. IMCC35008 TaxID=2653858 RepID=UPI0013D3D57F|nr:GNAT family acetyltransferase [Desulfopila sp. IMCC35008]
MAKPMIRPFEERDRKNTINLWQTCNITVPWNNPDRDIDRKLLVDPDLFLVLETQSAIIGSVMGGYEGHRGWIYYLAIAPDFRKRGYGKQLVFEIEKRLRQKGCPKVNLMVRTTNTAVLNFYTSLGYVDSEVLCLGKRLDKD